MGELFLLIKYPFKACGKASNAGVTNKVAITAKLRPPTKAHAKGSVKYV